MLQQQEQEEKVAVHATFTSHRVTDNSSDSASFADSDDSTATVSTKEQASTTTDAANEQTISV